MEVVRRRGLAAARHLRGDIWEVRVASSGNAYRILFAAEGRFSQILLALEAFQKTTQRTPPATIEVAERRLADWRQRGREREDYPCGRIDRIACAIYTVGRWGRMAAEENRVATRRCVARRGYVAAACSSALSCVAVPIATSTSPPVRGISALGLTIMRSAFLTASTFTSGTRRRTSPTVTPASGEPSATCKSSSNRSPPMPVLYSTVSTNSTEWGRSASMAMRRPPTL